MERFDIRGSDWGLQRRQDGLGQFCYAEQVAKIEQQLRKQESSVRWWKFAAFAWAVLWGVLAVNINYHRYDPQPVQKVSEEEHRAVVQKEQQAQAEKATLRKQLADEHARRLLTDKMLQTSNANNAKLVQQLKDIQASVPPLPVIQKAIHDEAKTDAGLKAAMVRNFGREIAGRVRVTE